jgi:hypothetical protein
LGSDRNRPPVETQPLAAAKPPWDQLRLRGAVEAQFLFGTLIAEDLVPFTHLPYRPVVLPIVPAERPNAHWDIVERQIAPEREYQGLADWLQQAERAWKKGRGEKAGRVSLYHWFDWQKKAAKQYDAPFKVVYNKSGSFLNAAVVRSRAVSA